MFFKLKYSIIEFMNNKTLSALGEFGLIDFIKKHNTKPSKIHNVCLDIGDDCFVYHAGKNTKYVVTADILIENVHFNKTWSTPEHIGQKAIEVNVSDIASMGSAKPLYAFISLGINKNVSQSFVKRLFVSIKKTCDKYGIHISGGDTVGAKDITVSVTLIGITCGKIIPRTGAKSGDLIFVSGTFGDGGAGLEILKKQSKNKKKLNFFEKELIKKHLLPQARLNSANSMSKKIRITSMTDSSDGLFKSIELLTQDKGAVINVNDIPLSENLISYCKKNYKKLYNLALFAGEEFELVFTVDKKDGEKAAKLFPEIKCIGYITDDKKTKYFEKGKIKDIKYDGYKHF